MRVALPGGRRVSGTVPDVYGTLLRSVTYSRVSPRHRLMTWVRFLALSAAHPEREFEAATVGRAVFGAAPRGTSVTVVRLPRMAPEVALERLDALVELFDEGRREPLPIACKSSAAYAEALHNGSDPVKAATGEWDGPWNFAGEGEDLEHALAFGGVLPFDELLGSYRVRRLCAPAVGRRPRVGAGRAPMTESFDVCGPLPTGVTVLEASAGTGKTFTIAALAARYVAEGIPLEQILMVTFTRMATGELRERVRERLVSAEHGLERALAGAPPQDDAVVQLLATGGPSLVALRRERLAAAFADFDSATIATTHGFCQEVLGGLGVLGDIESDTTFVEDISDLRDEVVDDLYLRRFARRGVPEFNRAQAMAIASAAIDNPAAPIEPADAPEDTIEAMRVRLAGAARDELEARKRRMGVMTYDDLLTRLSDTLAGAGGAVAAARLRARYRVVLVDEFQDTDPVQWQIMQTAFGDGEVTLVLIGDPKQAIYAFRGADVYAYLDAARTAGSEATLTTNWRSDQGLIDAYDALFGGAKLGHEGIVYREVRAAAANANARLHGAPDPAPLRIRVVPRDAVGLTAKGYALLEPARQHVACDVAADIVSLLRSGASIDGEGRVRPGHIAVLVRTNRNASRVRDALEAVDVPAVINGAGSVFGTDAGPRVAARARGDRAPLLPAARPLRGADHDPRLDHRAGRRRGRRRLGGRAPAPAPLGPRAAHEGRRVADGGDHAGGGPARARAGDGRRRAADDRPPPRRRAAPRRGDGRADGRDRVDGLAAGAGARGGERQQRRGAQPPARERRRGGPGADDAPQQGARVPGRLLPRPVGADVDPDATRRPRPSPSTTPTGSGRSTSGSPARSGTVT